MSWRTVIISTRCKLDYKMGYLVIRSEELKKIYLEEIAVLMIENPAVSFTGCLMEALTEKKIKVIFCDAKRSPVAELVPYHGSHDSSDKIRKQIQWSDSIKNQAWQRIIRQKITNQAALLSENKKTREMLLLQSYIDQVTPGDETNREGHAAKVYFNALFGMKFSRGADIPINAALNYGYAILLSAFNREIALNGYLTQIGIFHDNMFNHFNLSCDIIEPFRSLIDRQVCTMMPEQFGSDEKRFLWKCMHMKVNILNREQTVLNAIKIYTKKFFDAMNDQNPDGIIFPDWKFLSDD